MTKKIRRIICLLIIFLLIGLFIYLRFKSYNYEINYIIDKYKIKELYIIDENSYEFHIEYNDIIFPFKIDSKYLRKKELIQDIKVVNNEEEVCLYPQSEYLNFYPLCEKNKILSSYYLSGIVIDEFKYKKYEKNNVDHDKISINYLNNSNMLLYNYKGFYFLNNDEIKEIKLFNKDIYTIDLVYQYNEYLIVADYNQNYFFNKFYIINIETGKYEEMNLDLELSFDSKFLGDYKNSIYLIDKKSEKEYKINLKKQKIEETDFVILKNNRLENISYKEIINNNMKFEEIVTFKYEIINSNLYQIIGNYKIKLQDREITKIIKIDAETIYYLSNENLYMYNNMTGEILLISNFEWNFNDTNMIYLYK